MITGVSALCFVSIVGCVRLDVPEKILFGDLSRQLKKVLDWRSLLVFSVAAPVGGILINLTIGMRLIDARVSPDLYISIMNVLHWIPPLVAIQITYLIRKYLVRRNEGRIIGWISRRNVIGFFNSPIVVVLVGLVITGSLEIYLFWWLGRGFQFTNVYEFWAWSEITWARWTPFFLTIVGTFWLLRESEKDRAQYMGLESTKYPALRRYRQRIEFALEAIARTLSSLWALINSLKKDGSQATSKESQSQVAPNTDVIDLGRALCSQLRKAKSFNTVVEVSDKLARYVDNELEIRCGEMDAFSVLTRYVNDLQLINSCIEDDEGADVLLDEVLSSTETDVFTYLENFVSDDTDFDQVAEYVTLNFISLEDFGLWMAKGYFANTITEYLGELSDLVSSNTPSSKVTGSQVATDREIKDLETSTTGNEITVHCNASQDGDSVDCQITFSFSSDKDRPSHLFYKGNVTTVLSSGLGEGEEEFWNGIANGDDPEIWTSVSAKGKPTDVSVSGNISIYDLSEDGLVEDVIAKDSRSSEVDLNGNLVFIQCIGFDEDGDFILRVDLSDLEGSVIGIRAGFEDGIEEADWDIDIVDLDREDSCIRQLVVYDIEDGYLVSLEIRVGSIAFDNYPFRLSASINA